MIETREVETTWAVSTTPGGALNEATCHTIEEAVAEIERRLRAGAIVLHVWRGEKVLR